MIMTWIVWAEKHSVAAVTLMFVLIFVSTYWPGRGKVMEQHGRIPLDDDA
jgi:cbb3-type cytochrome oxidase subunit 3